MSLISIREATVNDADQIFQMILDLATFEGSPNGPKITADDIKRDGFEIEPPHFYCYIAECIDTKITVGFVMWHFTYSSWLKLSIYLENLYVRPEFRQQKIGHKLFKKVCQVAKERGVEKIDWNVLARNFLAQKFYETRGSYDVYKVEGRSTYRLLNDEILKVANTPS